MVEKWTEIDVSTWGVEHQEPRGKRPKSWVRGTDGQLWLRKEPRESRPTEPALEALVLRLARAVGVPAPKSYACRWGDSRVAREKRGIVVQIFTTPSEELSLGSVELRAAFPDYDPDERMLHTLGRVRTVLADLEPHATEPMLERFAQILAFDAWTGNSDRHQENWGVIRSRGKPRTLAPMYDPAACLGVELDPDHELLSGEVALDRYVERCSSGFGDGHTKKRLLPQGNVIAEASAWPEWQAGINRWLAAFASEMDTVEQVIECIPTDWLAPKRGALACRLLRARLKWLRGKCGV